MKLLSKAIKLGQMLVQEGYLSDEQLSNALIRQKAGKKKLGELLVDDHIVAQSAVLDCLSRRLGLDAVQLRPGLIDPHIVDTVDKEIAEQHMLMPMFKVGDTLTLAMAEPQALLVIDDLERSTKLKIQPVIALEANISESIKKILRTKCQN